MDLCICIFVLRTNNSWNGTKWGSSGVAGGVLRKESMDGRPGPPHFSWYGKEEALRNRLQSPPRIVIRHKRPQKGNKPSAAAATA